MSEPILVPMLKAINHMLGDKPENVNADKVQCAREVLGELIQHLEGKEKSGYHSDRIVPTDDLDPEAEQARRELTRG